MNQEHSPQINQEATPEKLEDYLPQFQTINPHFTVVEGRASDITCPARLGRGDEGRITVSYDKNGKLIVVVELRNPTYGSYTVEDMIDLPPLATEDFFEQFQAKLSDRRITLVGT